MNATKKIVIIGAYPPPVGGVSIHIQRLISLLSDKAEFDVIDESAIIKKDWPFNIRTLNLFKYFEIIRNADVIHIHSGLFIRRLFHVIICKLILRKFTVVTIHHNPEVEKFPNITKWLLKKCDHAILVNKEGYEMMETDSKCNYHLMPAFLPPIIDNEPELPLAVSKWISKKKGEKTIICVSNAWRLVLHNNEDLYGLDLCIEAIYKLREKGYNVCLIFVVASNPFQAKLMEDYRGRIKSFNLDDNILIWEKPLSFIRLVLNSDIVLRATNTDGDALSIREALYFNKIVIASDVVKRPDSVLLFKNRDSNDLAEKIQKSHIRPKGLKRDSIIDFAKEYEVIYNI